MTMPLICLSLAVVLLSGGIWWVERRIEQLIGALRAVDRSNSILVVQLRLHHRRIAELEREKDRSAVVPKVGVS